MPSQTTAAGTCSSSAEVDTSCPVSDDTCAVTSGGSSAATASAARTSTVVQRRATRQPIATSPASTATPSQAFGASSADSNGIQDRGASARASGMPPVSAASSGISTTTASSHPTAHRPATRSRAYPIGVITPDACGRPLNSTAATRNPMHTVAAASTASRTSGAP
ncbi:hypothetical protein NUM_33280 [Actinocatenispora comari]|uniref:Uncharacterized protein n=1 Tax=Actinocatenispora comari TaxID=2807577 RepID=A0A8J4ENU8_9ACTN|nr:hypothetical protein NUM_33280 [Actinocatenispora comari]